MERFKTSLETLTIPFRFILPLLLALFMYNYQGDQSRLNASMSDLKNGEQRIWTAVDDAAKTNDGKFSYVYQQCCGQAKYAPPQQ